MDTQVQNCKHLHTGTTCFHCPKWIIMFQAKESNILQFFSFCQSWCSKCKLEFGSRWMLIERKSFWAVRIKKHSSCWRRLVASSSEDVCKTSSRHLDQGEYIGVSYTSSEDVLIKTNIFVLAMRFQDVLKTSARRLAKTSSRRYQDIFKKSLRHIFKTSCKDVFKMFSRRIIRLNCLSRSSICLGYTPEKFLKF